MKFTFIHQCVGTLDVSNFVKKERKENKNNERGKLEQRVALLVKVERNAVMLHLLFPVYNYIHMLFQHLKEKRY